MKVILNKCYGGFCVSHKGYELYAQKKGISLYLYKNNYSKRNYEKISERTSDNLFITYFTKDFWDCFNYNKIDWQYRLYLGTEHREDPTLIEVIEELGEEASGRCGELVVVEIPDGMKYVIDEYDGFETLHEDVLTW